MVNKLHLDGLNAELISVENLLEEAESHNDIVGQFQLQQKKVELENEIKEFEENLNTNANIALYFGGKPVFGSKGIVADFASVAINQFQEIIDKVNAHDILGKMGARGKVPLAGTNSLMITEIAKGSFGFVFEEVDLDYEHDFFDSKLKERLNEVVSLITNTGAQDDELFQKVLSEIDGRTLTALKKFFSHLYSNKATVRLVEDLKDITLDDNAIYRGKIRTESIDIDEDDDTVIGIINGLLPDHKKFELVVGNETIYGSISEAALEQIQEYRNDGVQFLGEQWELCMDIRIVKPLNKKEKKYFTLKEFVRKIEE